MAMIDYGAVVFKNGVQVNHEMFMDMEEAVGWMDYLKSRYPDCDCLDEEGYAECGRCPRSKKKHFSHPDIGEWDAVVADCRGETISASDHLAGNFFAYVGDEELTFCFYKDWCQIVEKKEKTIELWGADIDYKDGGHQSYRGNANGTNFRIQKIANRICHFSMVYKGDSYHVIYGYGIDVDERIWNKVKVEYLGKKIANKVDRLYDRIRKPIEASVSKDSSVC